MVNLEQKIFEGKFDDYVSDDVMETLLEKCEFEVVDKSAMEKDDINQESFINVSLPTSNNLSDEELISRVKESVRKGNTDTQKLQLRHDGKAPNKIQIWRHSNGYSAFALHD